MPVSTCFPDLGQHLPATVVQQRLSPERGCKNRSAYPMQKQLYWKHVTAGGTVLDLATPRPDSTFCLSTRIKFLLTTVASRPSQEEMNLQGAGEAQQM